MRNLQKIKRGLKKDIEAEGRVYNRLNDTDKINLREYFKKRLDPLKDKLFFLNQLIDIQEYAIKKDIEID